MSGEEEVRPGEEVAEAGAEAQRGEFTIPADEQTVIGGMVTPRPQLPLPRTPLPASRVAPPSAAGPPTPVLTPHPGSLVFLAQQVGLELRHATAFAEAIGMPVGEVDSELLGCIHPDDARSALAAALVDGRPLGFGQRALFMKIIGKSTAV